MPQLRRGEVTKRIRARSVQLLGYPITTEELRLMPYLMYVMVNEHVIDSRKLNNDEHDILDKWRDAGHVLDTTSGRIKVTEEFWGFLCELIWLGYVDLRERP